jgi:hypothetical protein
MTTKLSLSGFVFAVLLIDVSVVAQEKFAPTVAATRRALQEGKIAEALAFHEAKAQEAERTRQRTLSPNHTGKRRLLPTKRRGDPRA